MTRQPNHRDPDQAKGFTTLNGNCQTLLQRTIQYEKSVSSLWTLYASHQSKITSVAKRYHPQWLNRSGILGKIFQPTVKHVFKISAFSKLKLFHYILATWVTASMSDCALIFPPVFYRTLSYNQSLTPCFYHLQPPYLKTDNVFIQMLQTVTLGL